MESKEKKGEKGTRSKKQPSKKRPTNIIKKNPWILSTIVLVILVIILLITTYTSGSSGKTVGEDFVKFINSKGGAQIEYVQTNDFSSNLYEVIVSSGGSQIPVYITKDGNYFVQIVSELTEEEPGEITPPEQNIIKSDRPEVELFIWSYCPYGVQAQEPLAEVAELLGDYVDFKGVLYYDGHGEYETQQNKIQECIQKIDADKYWEYASGFVKDIYPQCGSSRDIDCDKTESIKLMNSLGINSNDILNCVDTEGDDLIAAASIRAKELGVTGSPSLAINNVIVQPSSRTAEGFKDSICMAFNNIPEECSTILDGDSSVAAAGNC